MIRSLLLVLLLAVSAGAPVAFAGDEPSDPEPVEDFWTAEEEAIEHEQAANAEKEAAQQAAEQQAQAQAAPVAPAPGVAAPPVAPLAPAPARCDPDAMLRVALDALRPLARRTLPARAGRPLGTLKLTPCMAGRVRLAIVAADTGAVLASAERTLRTTRTATFRPTTTDAVRRYAGRGPLRLRLRADFSLR